MSTILPTVSKPPVTPTPPPFLERVKAVHRDAVAVGPTGPVVLFLCMFSSSFILLKQGTIFLYNRVRGYA